MIRGKRGTVAGARNHVCFDMFGLLRADRRPAVRLRRQTLGNGYFPFVLRPGGG